MSRKEREGNRGGGGGGGGSGGITCVQDEGGQLKLSTCDSGGTCRRRSSKNKERTLRGRSVEHQAREGEDDMTITRSCLISNSSCTEVARVIQQCLVIQTLTLKEERREKDLSKADCLLNTRSVIQYTAASRKLL